MLINSLTSNPKQINNWIYTCIKFLINFTCYLFLFTSCEYVWQFLYNYLHIVQHGLYSWLAVTVKCCILPKLHYIFSIRQALVHA